MHSKGPWHTGGLAGTRVGVFSKDGGLIASVNKGYQDAHLIAAAPEMLEALKAMLEVHNEPCRLDHHGLCQTHHLRRNEAGEPECEVQLVRAAISKAKGETGP